MQVSDDTILPGCFISLLQVEEETNRLWLLRVRRFGNIFGGEFNVSKRRLLTGSFYRFQHRNSWWYELCWTKWGEIDKNMYFGISTAVNIYSIKPLCWYQPFAFITRAQTFGILQYVRAARMQAMLKWVPFSPYQISYCRILVHFYHYPSRNVINQQTTANPAPVPQLEAPHADLGWCTGWLHLLSKLK